MAYDWRAGMQRLGSGLGQVRNALLPIPEEVASQLDPRTIEALRRQAVLQAGLGMMSAGEKGAGLGTGAMYGLNQAQQGLGQGVNQAWMGKRAAREDERLDLYERRMTAAETRAAATAKQAQENWQKSYGLDAERLRLAQEAAARGEQLTPYQSRMLQIAEAEATRERETRDRINKLITARRKYPRGSADWQLLQDEIDSLEGRSVDRSLGGGLPGGLPSGAGETEDAWNTLTKPNAQPPAVPAMPAAPAQPSAPRGPGLGAAVLGPQPSTAEINSMIAERAGSALTRDDSPTARVNQRVAAKLQGISWEEWRRRNGLPPVAR
jgi:hypothetical protein